MASVNKDTKQKIFVTDLDGTLLNSNREVSAQDLKTLRHLGNKHCIRVAATGRSLYSINKVLPQDFPFDYIIFSCGAGIIDWRSKILIHKNHLTREEVVKAAEFMIEQRISFTIQDMIPNNHQFYKFRSQNACSDYDNRCVLYHNHILGNDDQLELIQDCSQLLAIAEENNGLYEFVKSSLPEFNVIRATSPLDGHSLWIEVFPNGVSKGNAVQWLCHYLGIGIENSVGVGNDYNDLDFLRIVQDPYVVSNSPEELKREFDVVASNDQSGVSEAADLSSLV